MPSQSQQQQQQQPQVQNQQQQHEDSENNLHDFSFDLSQLDSSTLLGGESMGQSETQNSMDVDQDVADWLDSLMPTNQRTGGGPVNPVGGGGVGVGGGKKFPELNGNNMLLQRGDPLMASTFSSSNSCSTTNHFDF